MGLAANEFTLNAITKVGVGTGAIRTGEEVVVAGSFWKDVANIIVLWRVSWTDFSQSRITSFASSSYGTATIIVSSSIPQRWRRTWKGGVGRNAWLSVSAEEVPSSTSTEGLKQTGWQSGAIANWIVITDFFIAHAVASTRFFWRFLWTSIGISI